MSTSDQQRRMLRLCAGLSAVSALGTGAPALAQQEGLEEIVVSARFREENLQETPLAITAFSGENLEARNLTDEYTRRFRAMEPLQKKPRRPGQQQ